MTDRPIVLVHVPKSGGTSITASLARLFTESGVHRAYDGLPESGAGFGEARLVASHARLVDLARVDPRAIFIASVRRPSARLVSLYRFWSSHRSEECCGRDNLLETRQLSFADFVVAPPAVLDNEMVRQFADVPSDRPCTVEDLAAAKAGLDACAAILRAEDLDDDLRDLYRRIGCESLFALERLNVTDDNSRRDPSRFEAVPPVDLEALSEPTARALHHLVHLDAQLYAYACGRIATLRAQPLTVRVERPVLQRGETIRPCHDLGFLGLLAGGWGQFEQGGGMWSVGRFAALAFKAPSERAEVKLVIEPCLPPGRTHMTIEVAYGATRTKILFLREGADLTGSALVDCPDRICVGSSPVVVAIALDDRSSGEHVVRFDLPKLSSPLMLGQSLDNRTLGVSLLSLELV